MGKLGQQVQAQQQSQPRQTRVQRLRARLPQTISQPTSAERIQNNLTLTEQRISQAQDKLNELKNEYQEKKNELQEDWRDRPSSFRSNTSNRESHNKELKRLKDKYDANAQEQRGLIKGYQEAKESLSRGNDIQFGDIQSYAGDLGKSYELKEDSNQARQAQATALRNKNARAQAKGFNITGTLTEINVDPVTKKEKVVGTRYYEKGAEISPTEFAEKFDIYKKPSGDSIIVPKGTDLQNLTPEQERQLFPLEYRQAEAKESIQISTIEGEAQAPVSKPAMINLGGRKESITSYDVLPEKVPGVTVRDFVDTSGIEPIYISARSGKYYEDFASLKEAEKLPKFNPEVFRDSLNFYDNIPFESSSTKAVEIGTGRIATQNNLNTANAKLEDHYFIKTADGKLIDVGIYDPMKRSGRAQGSSKITGMAIADSDVEQDSTFFTKAKDSTIFGLGYVGDIIGSLLADTSLSGSRSLISTTIPEEELIQRRQSIKDKAFNFAAAGIFSISGGGAATGFTGKSPTYLEAQVESFQLRRDLYAGGEEAKGIESKRESQVQDINIASLKLEEINKEVENLNNQINPEKQLSIEEATSIQEKYSELQMQRSDIYRGLESKGIKTNLNIESGIETLTFTSPELEKDIFSSSVKEFRTKTPGQKKVAIADVVGQEIVETAILGLGLGASGTLAKAGGVVAKVPGVTKIITKFPTATKIAAETLFIGSTVTVAGFQSFRTGTEFKQAGLEPLEGYLLGFGVPAGKGAGFYAGAKIGTKIYTKNILAKVEKGGFTKTVNKEFELNGKKAKLPAEGRAGKTIEGGGKSETAVMQGSQKETRIPGTDIKISQEDYLAGKYNSGAGGLERGKIFTKVTRGDAPILKGSTGEATTYLIRPEGQDKTGILLVNQKKGGVNVQMFRTGIKGNNVNILKEFSDGSKLYTLDFQRPIEKVGESIFVKNAQPSDYLKIKNAIDINRLFTRFAGEDKLYTIARTKQLVFETAKVPTGILDTPSGKIAVTTQKFYSVGTTKAGRVDAIKDILKNYGISEKDQLDVFTLLADKRGQVTLAPFGSNPGQFNVATPELLRIKDFIAVQDISNLNLESTLKSIGPIASSDISLRSLLGANALLGLSQFGKTNQTPRVRQTSLQSQINKLEQLNIQQQKPIQINDIRANQKLQQPQEFQLRQITTLSPPIITTPIPTPTPTPPTFSPTNFDLDFASLIEDKLRKRKKLKKGKKDLFYVQDFTSKVLDLPAVEVTPEQLKKIIKGGFTGLEIRPPIKIKGNKRNSQLDKAIRSAF